jgi:hypothetical protein
VSEKPLHVQVAEALGCKVMGPVAKGWDRDGGPVLWYCNCELSGHEGDTHEARDCHDPYRLARYDEDWSATGPLIEKYGICQYLNCGVWHSYTASDGDDCGDGATPLESFCHLIIALGKAGKL